MPRYENYCILQISPDRKKIAFGSKNGFLDVFEEFHENEWKLKRIVEERIFESKIFSILWLDNEIILICGENGFLKILKIYSEGKIKVINEFDLPPSRECWTTAAILKKNLLICGDRSGNIFIFKIEKNSINKKPRQIFSKIHGKLGVQFFDYFGEKLISSGRDGTLQFYKISEESSENFVKILHKKKMPIEWISKTLKTKNNFFILGFREIEFMIFSTFLNRLILRINCGGGHRSWDCFINEKNFINFVCIRDKQIQIFENNSAIFNNNSIISGFHKKEIHSLEIIPTISNRKIFISGSEDCSIRISILNEINSKKFDFNPLDLVDGHISNIKILKILNLTNNKEESRNLIFSAGGRAQLKIWQLIIDIKSEMLINDNIEMIEKTSFMLRGTDKDRRKLTQNKMDNYFLDPETRFMDIDFYFDEKNSNLIILFLACSDGFIRIIFYDIEKNSISLATELFYLNRCIIKIHIFNYENELILITMATDGIINFWQINSIIMKILSTKNDIKYFENSIKKPFEKIIAHQSGINSFDFFKNKKNEFFLSSGGDDNKLNLIIFKIMKNSLEKMSIKILANWNSISLFSAQITGLKFIGENLLLSVSIDQKIVMHKFKFENGILIVSMINDGFIFIADVQGLTICNFDNNEDLIAIIYGQGLEAIKLKKN